MSSIEFYNNDELYSAQTVLQNAGFVELENGDYCHIHNAVECNNEHYHIDDSDIRHCEHCNEAFHTDDSYVYTECGSEFCDADCADHAGYYYWDDGTWNDTPQPCLRGLLDYCQTNETIAEATKIAPYRIGFEVEKEDSEYDDFHAYDDCNWIAVSDGSLCDETGFELVSPCYNLRDLEDIREDIDSMTILDADTSNSCGGHITVSELDRTGEQLHDRLGDFVPLLFTLYPGRLRGTYAKPTQKQGAKSREKFRAINVQDNRVEFRIFSAVESRAQLDWRLRLCNWAMHNATGDSCENQLWQNESELRALLLEVYTPEKLAEKMAMFLEFKKWHNASDTQSTESAISEYIKNVVKPPATTAIEPSDVETAVAQYT